MEGGGGRFDGLVKLRGPVSNKKGHDLVSRILLLELGVARCLPLLGAVLHATIAACTCTCKRNALLSRVTYIAEQIKNVRRQQLAVAEAIPVVALLRCVRT